MTGIAIDSHHSAQAGTARPVNDNSGVFSGLESNPCIVTQLAGMTFAIPIAHVEDLFATPAITPVPLAPRYIAGLLNLRGKVMTVLCLACRMGLKLPGDSAPPELTIGVTHKNETYGVLVDDVGEVIALPAEEREPVPSHFHAAWTQFAAGIHKSPSGLIIELDVAALLHNNTLPETA
ncbi:MAG: chemotaxis protein CheW [Beijerinckiaceae bacterium]